MKVESHLLYDSTTLASKSLYQVEEKYHWPEHFLDQAWFEEVQKYKPDNKRSFYIEKIYLKFYEAKLSRLQVPAGPRAGAGAGRAECGGHTLDRRPRRPGRRHRRGAGQDDGGRRGSPLCCPGWSISGRTFSYIFRRGSASGSTFCHSLTHPPKF